jgi:hypothetical protein
VSGSTSRKSCNRRPLPCEACAAQTCKDDPAVIEGDPRCQRARQRQSARDLALCIAHRAKRYCARRSFRKR